VLHPSRLASDSVLFVKYFPIIVPFSLKGQDVQADFYSSSIPIFILYTTSNAIIFPLSRDIFAADPVRSVVHPVGVCAHRHVYVDVYRGIVSA
jgi:hypothetical protein